MKAEKAPTFQVIGLFGRAQLERNSDFVKKLERNLKKRGCQLLWDANVSKVLSDKGQHSHPYILKNADLVILLGGDGTILKTVRDLPKRKNLYFFGINLGNLGFLCEAQKPEKSFELLDEFFKEDYILDERLLLRATLYRKGEKLSTHLALNDIVINQGNFARLIKLRTEIDQRKMVQFKADGVIFASPTGSTGHSLSAGGPIIHPSLDAFIFTPICPSELSLRPIVIPSNRQVTITIETERRFQDNKIGLTIDGQIVLPVEYGDQIKIRKSSRKLRFIRRASPRTNYYRILRDKLKWGK
jgi:NAD+ kinase